MRILLLSGGLDSVTLLYWSLKPIDLCLSVDYGQPHLSEIDAARRVCELRGMPHEIARVTFPTPLSAGLLGGNDRTPSESVVPGRNSAFVALAAMRGARSVVLGCNADDQGAYVDCRASVLAAVGRACGVNVELPFVGVRKREIVRIAKEMRVPSELSISCYRGTGCGVCAACVLRDAAESHSD